MVDFDFSDYPIRTATAADAEELAAHVNAGYRGESSRAGWTTEDHLVAGTRTTAEQLRAEIGAPNARIEIMRDPEGRILACVHLVRESPGSAVAEGVAPAAADSSEPVCYLGMLTVRPTRQGAGIGKHFLAHAERVARDWGCAQIRMGVIDQRPELIAYYERRGYSRTGVALPFHFDDPRFGVPKRELRLVELAKNMAS